LRAAYVLRQRHRSGRAPWLDRAKEGLRKQLDFFLACPTE